MVSLDPRDPGGITAVVASWKEAGLAAGVDLVEIHTSAMGSPLPVKVAQAARAVGSLLSTLLGGRRPDVVHLHASTGGSLLRKLVMSWCCALLRVPYVAHMHSGAFERWVASSRLNRLAMRSFFGGAATVIVLSERWRITAASLGARRVEVLPNGIAARERDLLHDARGAGARADPPVLLFYGRWAPIKGLDRLGDALRAMPRSDYELRVFGSGDRRWLEKALAGAPGRVSILGWLGADRKVAELGAAAALVAPSRSEGFPMALVEARAAGTPVIAADVGAVGEALAGYESGLLLDTDDRDALRRAIEDLLDGAWPAEPDASPFPPSLLSDGAVTSLIAIYRSIARGD